MPTAEDLRELSRDEWESLAHDICAVMYDTERVEDRLGRGNGLDALRQPKTGGLVEGWQFRRFDARLGAKQIAELRGAVARAVVACKRDLGGSLRKFTVFGSLDLQPGHGRAKGEDARFAEFRQWCQTQHGVAATYRGITWVRARLLKHPYLRPQLFEDLNGALASAKDEILAAIGSDRAMRDAFAQLTLRSSGQLSVLLTEARTHFERGQTRGQLEEWRAAIESLRDARRLAMAPGVETTLLAMIQTVLAGLLCVTGHIDEAVAIGREALAAATKETDAAVLRLVQGNLAMALTDAQQFREARALFVRVLGMYEDADELPEVVRTLTHLLHVDVCLDDLESGSIWAKRLEVKARALDRAIGPSEMSLNAMGNIASFHLNATLKLPQDRQAEGFHRVVHLFQQVSELAKALGIRRTVVLAESQLARVLGLLARYDEADLAFERVVSAADEDGLEKAAADSRFNQAVMHDEANRLDNARKAAADALSRYKTIGDPASALDAERLLAKIGTGDHG